MIGDAVFPGADGRSPAAQSMLPVTEAEVILAIISVHGFTVACAEHGDRATLDVLTSYYDRVTTVIARDGGRVVKTIGDGLLISFPADDPRRAVATLRTAAAEATAAWSAFDPRCSVAVKAGIGTVLSGRFAPHGSSEDDVFGDFVNRLFKTPTGPFVVLPDLEARLS